MIVSFVVTEKIITKYFASPIKNKSVLAKATVSSKKLAKKKLFLYW